MILVLAIALGILSALFATIMLHLFAFLLLGILMKISPLRNYIFNRYDKSLNTIIEQLQQEGQASKNRYRKSYFIQCVKYIFSSYIDFFWVNGLLRPILKNKVSSLNTNRDKKYQQGAVYWLPYLLNIPIEQTIKDSSHTPTLTPDDTDVNHNGTIPP